MTRTLAFVLLGILLSATGQAQPKDREKEKAIADSLEAINSVYREIDSIENSLHYKTGLIELPGGVASIQVPAGFKFLESAEAKRVLEDIWGNPAREKAPLGLLFPENSGATDPGGYAFVVQYEDIGYVKDEDADKIDYTELLKDLKKGSEEENEERKKAGLTVMNLVGWAAPPHYDKEKKVLYWAKEFSVPGNETNTLNYDVRVLGRKGVLTMQAISQMDEIDSVNRHIDDVLKMVSFKDGNRYDDFDSNTDEVAAWTIGGLVAGKLLAKAGLWALILKNIKLVIAGLALLGGGIWRFITGRRKKQEEETLEQPVAGSSDPGNPVA